MKKSISLSELTLRTPDGQPYDIPERGSLALLALGDIGIQAWRQQIASLRRARIEAVLEHRRKRDADPTKPDTKNTTP